MGDLVFLGSKAAGLRICSVMAERLGDNGFKAIVCFDDNADARSVLEEFRALAERLGVAFHVVGKVSETVAVLEELRAATAIVHGWYQILPVDRFPDMTFLGFHYSPLPRYRGSAPLVWQIIAGETHIGVSLFQMVAAMDAGRLYDRRQLAIGSEDNIGDALALANDAAAEMAIRLADDLIAGTLMLRDQPDEPPSYCAVRVPDDGMVNWKDSGDRIHDFIRAQTRPYPGAFTSLPDGSRLVIWKSAREDRAFMGAPGAVGEITTEHVVVTAATGAVRLIEVQVEGSDPAPASAVLRSLRTRLGQA